MRNLCSFLFILLVPILAYSALSDPTETEKKEELESPPENLPVIVESSFYLWNINQIDEKNETYSCEFYLMLSWNDPRLAFTGSNTPLIFGEDAAAEKLKDVWWPELDFVNASAIEQRNRTLFIYPNGKVEYSLKILSTFYSPMDFRMFPFDTQRFKLDVESFLWDSKTLQFVIKKEGVGFLPASDVKNMHLVTVEADVTEQQFPYMDGSYSNLGMTLIMKRRAGFFNFQILLPLVVVLLLNCCMFYLDVDDLSTRLYLSQGSILVFVAMKFMINESLPDIDYLTIVDYIFFIAYFCCCIAAMISCLDYYLWKKRNAAVSKRINKAGIIAPIVLFFFLYLALLFVAKVI